MTDTNVRTREHHGTERRLLRPRVRLPVQSFDSRLRHYVWGTAIVLMGFFTMFGIWFLLGG